MGRDLKIMGGSPPSRPITETLEGVPSRTKKTSLNERSFIERSLRLLKHTVKFIDGGAGVNGYLLKHSVNFFDGGDLPDQKSIAQ